MSPLAIARHIRVEGGFRSGDAIYDTIVDEACQPFKTKNPMHQNKKSNALFDRNVGFLVLIPQRSGTRAHGRAGCNTVSHAPHTLRILAQGKHDLLS